MSRQIFKNDKGFTLVELIMVIVIIGILASVAVPKFVNLSDAAYTAKCAANRGAINSAIAMQYASMVAAHPDSASWMENLAIGGVQATWFATGAVPACPKAGVYSLVNAQVSCTVHGV